MAVAVVALSPPIGADETVDEAMIARLKIEGLQHSRVMETLTELTDTFGGRLCGSPSYVAAADWAKQRLNEFVLSPYRHSCSHAREHYGRIARLPLPKPAG
jgi:hypothetical protein